MQYDPGSMNNFVQKQGGSLANLGATPSYTGAPAKRGTPPGPQAQQAYQQANPNAAFQRQLPAGVGMPQTSLANLGRPVDPRMRQAMMQRQQQAPVRQDPRYRQRMEAIRRRRNANPRRGNLRNLGRPMPRQATINPIRIEDPAPEIMPAPMPIVDTYSL